jgi:transcription antitermination factor NusG
MFGRVGRVLGYTMHLHVILQVQDEPYRKLVSFLDAEVLNTDGALPILSMARPRLGSQVLVLKGQYEGLVGRVARVELRRSTLTLKLDVAKREATLNKGW